MVNIRPYLMVYYNKTTYTVTYYGRCKIYMNIYICIHTYVCSLNCRNTWNSSDRKSSAANVVFGYWLLLHAHSMVQLYGRLGWVGLVVSSTFRNSLHNVPLTPLTCMNATNNSINCTKNAIQVTENTGILHAC